MTGILPDGLGQAAERVWRTYSRSEAEPEAFQDREVISLILAETLSIISFTALWLLYAENRQVSWSHSPLALRVETPGFASSAESAPP